MKELFKLLRSTLMSVQSIRWVDLDKGQIDQYETRPAIDFPAVLLNIELPNTDKITNTSQQCDVMITVQVVFDFMDDTDSATPTQILDKSLAVFDIVKEVHEKLQGLRKINVVRKPLERKSTRTPKRPDRIKVFQSVYNTRIID